MAPQWANASRSNSLLTTLGSVGRLETNTDLLLLVAAPEEGRGGGALRLISTGLTKTLANYQLLSGHQLPPLPHAEATAIHNMATISAAPGAQHGVVERERLFDVGSTRHVDVRVADAE